MCSKAFCVHSETQGSVQLTRRNNFDSPNVAIFVGMSFFDYSQVSFPFLDRKGESLKITGRNLSVAAGRISYQLGFTGASMTVDTACSSSLACMHLGRKDIEFRKSNHAMISSILLCLDPKIMESLAAAAMLSPKGRSATLDSSADGYGRAEASVSLIMTSVSNNGLAMIRGSSINQDGRSASLTAPYGPSQTKVVSEALRDGEVSYVHQHELHGTGTPLGDPIEINALFKEHTNSFSTHPVVLSASKTWLGHAEPAAGAVGLGEALNYFAAGMGQKIVFLTDINKHIKDSISHLDIGLFLPRENFPVAPEKQRFVGISAFAFQGTNAHMIVRSFSQISRVSGVSPMIVRHKRFWFCPICPFWLTIQMQKSKKSVALAEVNLAHGSLGALRDHLVSGRVLLPGTFFFHALYTLTSLLYKPTDTVSDLLLANLIIMEPMVLDSRQPDSLHAHLECNLQLGKSSFCTIGRLNRQISSSIAVKARDPMVKRVKEEPLHELPLRKIKKQEQTSVGQICQRHEKNLIPSMTDSITHLGAHLDVSVTGNSFVPVSLSVYKIWEGSKTVRSLRSRTSPWGSCYSSAGSINSSNRMRSYKTSMLQGSNSFELGGLNSKRLTNDGAKQKVSIGEYYQILSLVSEIETRPGYPQIPSFGPYFNNLDNTLYTPRTTVGGKAGIDQFLPMLEITLGVKNSRQEVTFSAFKEFEILPSNRYPSITSMMSNALARTYSRENSAQRIMTQEPSQLDPWNKYRSAPVEVDYLSSCKMSKPQQAMHVSRKLSGNLFTGGTYGVGLLLATCQQCSRRCCEQVLISRSGKLRGSQYMCRILTEGSNLIHFGSCDVTRRIDVECYAQLFWDQCIGSIFHCAGILQDTLLDNQTSGTCRKVFAPKPLALDILFETNISKQPFHQLFAASSISYLIGNMGQTNYASANAAMDGIALNLSTQGININSIPYGPWTAIGMAARDERTMARLKTQGIYGLSPERGLFITLYLLKTGESKPLAARMEYKKFLQTVRLSTRELLPRCIDQDEDKSSFKVQMEQPKMECKTADQKILPIVQEIVENITGHPVGLNDPLFEVSCPVTRSKRSESNLIVETPINDLQTGIDSLGTLEIRNEISSTLGIPLPSTLIFDFPTIEALSQELSQEKREVQQLPERMTPQRTDPSMPTAIKDIAYIMPSREGSGITPFVLLSKQQELQSSVPMDRWDNEDLYTPLGTDVAGAKLYTRFAAFINPLWTFDPSLFKIQPLEAIHLDPQVRGLLRTVLMCSDGLHEKNRDIKAGTFVGCMFYDYLKVLESSQVTKAPSVIGNGAPYLGGRVAFTFDFQGPCVGIDTACSSSLVAVHQGKLSIDTAETTVSISCGVNAIISPETTSSICKLRALSETGRCKSMDSLADGYGRGEGFIAINLSMLPHNEVFLSLLDASSINQDGRGSSLTAPHGPAQSRVVQNCLQAGETSPDDIFTASLHLTGTPLGDPIEIQALQKAMSEKKNYLTALAVKILSGHTEGAAGCTGLLLSLASTTGNAVPGASTLRFLNPFIGEIIESHRGDDKAMNIPRSISTAVNCTNGSNLSSCSSSFGMSGTNAHAVIQSCIRDKHRALTVESLPSWKMTSMMHFVFGEAIWKFVAESTRGASVLRFQLSQNPLHLRPTQDHIISGIYRYFGRERSHTMICESIFTDCHHYIRRSMHTSWGQLSDHGPHDNNRPYCATRQPPLRTISHTISSTNTFGLYQAVPMPYA